MATISLNPHPSPADRSAPTLNRAPENPLGRAAASSQDAGPDGRRRPQRGRVRQPPPLGRVARGQGRRRPTASGAQAGRDAGTPHSRAAARCGLRTRRARAAKALSHGASVAAACRCSGAASVCWRAAPCRRPQCRDWEQNSRVSTEQ